jgi:phosphate-selective porin OprO and OprP
MKHCYVHFCIFLLYVLIGSPLVAQEVSPSISPTPYFSYGKGLSITSPDSMFMLNIRFRMQNRLGLTSRSEDDLEIETVEARVRRLRLRLEGFLYTPRLTYVLQLAFSRADMDYDDTGFPNVIRDAMILYAISDHFAIGLGQTKLPGNRQRVISSGDLQLPDRSIVNSIFNIDRDFGVQVYYNNHLQKMHYVLRGAISSGEGRNITSSDRGLAYTTRAELLPLGKFSAGGDYFEGDLMREVHPKLSIGITYSYNQNAIRTGGQLGKFLFTSRDIETRMLDLLFKHRGWAFLFEYLKRSADDPVTTNNQGEQRWVYTGAGMNYQGSYMFKSHYEITARFSQVLPHQNLTMLEEQVRQYTMGGTRYIRGHRLKLQADLTYEDNAWLAETQPNRKNWQVRFQIEAGI